MFKKLFVLLVVVFVFGLGGFFWWEMNTAPVAPDNEKAQIFVVPQGLSSDEVGDKLREAGLIKSTLAFEIMIYKEGISDQVQAGDFRLSPSMNLSEIAQSLTHGTLDIWVTIPEGLRKEEVAIKIADAFKEYNAFFDTQKFLTQASALEGHLFPDTYLIPKDATPEMVIEMFNNNFENKFSLIKQNTNLNKKQIVILASLIEREAKYKKDRAIISGIITKRLKRGWALQIDAAIQYAKANREYKKSEVEMSQFKWWPKVNPDDLKIDSPYNTYEEKGLPPTPICNPSLASLEAAANPKTSEYWFYLSDDSGKTYYAETLEKHDKNIGKYLND